MNRREITNDFIPTIYEAGCDIDTSRADVIMENVGPRTIFYRLGESEVFEYANKNTTLNGIKLIDVIPRMTMEDHGFRFVDYKDLDKSIQYELFESPRYKINGKRNIANMIETGKIQMVYSDEYRIPTSIPFIIQTSGSSKVRIFVNVTDFLDMDQYGKYQVTHTRNYNALMAILFAACVAYKIASTGATLPADIADAIVLMYANMLERVINLLVHMDPITRDKVRYLCTKFALIQMYGTEKGEELFYRYQNKYFPKLSKMITDTLDSQFALDSFDKLSLFVEELRKQYPSMRNLTDFAIYDRWIRSYGAATTLSLDYLGYHIYTVCMVLFESPLISRVALEPVMEKNRGTELYKRLPMFLMS